MKYVLDCGKFINPFTRTAISDTDLKRLHNIYLRVENDIEQRLTYHIGPRRYRLNKTTDILHVRTALQRIKREDHQREELITYFQERCLNTVNIVLDMVINLPSRDMDVVTQVMTYIINYHFTQFWENFHHLLQVNMTVAGDFLEEISGKLLQTADATMDDFTQTLIYSVSKLFIAQHNEIFLTRPSA